MADLDWTNWDTAGQGYRDAADGEPLYPEAATAYAAGWLYFHGIEDPYSLTSGSQFAPLSEEPE